MGLRIKSKSKSAVKKFVNIGVGEIVLQSINRDGSKKGYKIVGDVDYDDIIDKVNSITPVPGGVGPMTITMLLSNTVLAAERKLIKET